MLRIKKWLNCAAQAILLLSLASCYVEGKLSVVQGATTKDQTQIHIISAENESLAFFYEDKNQKLYQVPNENIQKYENVLEQYSIYKILIKNLEVKHKYTLNIISENKRKLVGRKTFYTMKRDTFRRVAVTSCAGDFIDEAKTKKMWQQLVDLWPDALLMIGDNAYVDVTKFRTPVAEDAEVLMQRYIDHRFSLPIYMIDELIPVYATWDDHDYGKKDGDKSFALKERMQETFKMMYAQDESSIINEGPGVSRMVQMGDYQVALLDNRSFRDSKEKKEGEHFGAAQRFWLKDHLKKKTPTLIVSGDHFWGDYHKFESFYGLHKKNFEGFISEIKKTDSLVIFMSGDRHMSEVQKIPSEWLGYETLELTSSPIHSTLYPDRSSDHPNPRRVWANSDQFNFMILEMFDANPKHMSLGVSYWGENGILWKSPFKIDKK